MKVTFLSENSRLPNYDGLGNEHGLSLFIEHADLNILFDTGASDLYCRNAQVLGVDLSRTNFAVLSHGHHDHGGGLRCFLELHPNAPVYLSSLAFNELYNTVGAEPRYIGLDRTLQETNADRFRPVGRTREIADGVWMITDIPRRFPEPAGNRSLSVKQDSNYSPDPFHHEIILCILDGQRVFAFTGCSHHGVLNMLDAVEQSFPDHQKVLVSGFHMMNPRTGAMDESSETVRFVAQYLRDHPNVENVITGHCTGQDAYAIMKSILGGKLSYGATGAVFEF